MKKFIQGRLLSFGPAFKGLVWLFKNEANAQFHLTAIIVVVIAGFCCQLSSAEWIYISIAIGLVICTEALNTAIEKTIDLLHPQQSKKAGLVKDIAAGAVLAASIIAVVIAALVFIPKLLN